MGALQLFEDPDMPDVHVLDAKPVSAAKIAKILNGHRSHPLGMVPEEDDFRISMAGAQEKTAFLWYRDKWHRPHATTPTTHIFKLPIGRIEGPQAEMDLRQSVANEWLCLQLAGGLGLPVAKAQMERFREVEALVVERFDRRWSDDRRWIIRLPQEDMCQALGFPPSMKYESEGGPGMKTVMELLLQSQSPRQDRSTFFRACFVYWLLGAIDGHAKNFSIFLLPGGRLKLTPLYDILSAYPLEAAKQIPKQKLKMAMAVDGKNRHYRWLDIVRDHWLTTAKECAFPQAEAEGILDDVTSRVDDVIDQTRDALPEGFPPTIANPIFDGMRKARQRARVKR